MENIKTGNENIAEALKLLEAAAEQKKDELKSLLSDKYTHLRGVLMETEGTLAQSLRDATKHAAEVAKHAKDVSIEKTREIADGVDKNVHQSPWVYIGGATVISLLLGYVLGRNRSK